MFSFIAHTKGLFNKVLSALEFQCHNIYDCDIRNTNVLTINAELITRRGGGDCASDLIGFPLTGALQTDLLLGERGLGPLTSYITEERRFSDSGGHWTCGVTPQWFTTRRIALARQSFSICYFDWKRQRSQTVLC